MSQFNLQTPRLAEQSTTYGARSSNFMIVITDAVRLRQDPAATDALTVSSQQMSETAHMFFGGRQKI